MIFCDTQTKPCHTIPKILVRTLVVYSKSARLTLGASSEGRQKQLWIVYRKPCYLYLHHRYKRDFTRPWHLGISLLTQVRKLRAFPILLGFQMKVRFSHFPLSMENLMPWGWNGFYVILDTPKGRTPSIFLLW